jgi:copper resistance protein C
MIRARSTRLAALFALTMIGTAAFAHALLQKAVPAVGGTVSSSPTEIRLKFSEGVEPAFSGIALSTQSGAAAPLGKASVDPADNSTLIAPVRQPLKPGVYTVTWHAVSVDTHKTQGSFQFTIQP